jgi:type IX secretion system PorP/SprF family membrane protein
MMTKNISIFFLILWRGFSGFAQDPQFSQFYAAPLYLNPAFTGATEEHRFITNYRNQWPGMANGYVTYSFSYDYNMKNLNSGVGILATADKAGSANLGTTNLGFLYSYKIRLSNKWVVTPGIHFGYGKRGINREKLILMDQLKYGEANNPSNDPLIFAIGNTNYFDFGSGLLLYNRYFWAGVSAYHMNEPNLTLIEDESKLKMKTSVHAGAKIPIKNGPFRMRRNASIAPSFIYKKQGEIDQLDMGVHFYYDPIMIGFWYRGIPIMKNEVSKLVSQDALAFLIGLRHNEFTFGYSYDVTISSLGPSSGGAHEVSLSYSMSLRKNLKVRREKFIPCPTFLLNSNAN